MTRPRALNATIALLVASGAPAAHAEILWHSNAAVDRWNEAQVAAPDRITVGPSPVAAAGAPVLRVELKPGDVALNRRHDPPVPLGSRAELVHLPAVTEGTLRWYRWRVFFPEGFSVSDPKGGGDVFAQWHHRNASGEPGSPPLLLTADASSIRVVVVPEVGSKEAITVAQTPQKLGQWRDIILHVVFSSDPSTGFIAMWVDGQPVVSTHVATLFPGYESYLKMGLYRRPTVPEDNVIYLGEVTEATHREDVWP